MGHPQPPTPMETDNSTAFGIVNESVKQKRSKAMDMRYYWIRDRVRQGQYHVYWREGKLNRADYYTKHHSPAHHQMVRPAYLHVPNISTRNYFQALQDTNEDEDEEEEQKATRKSQATGEGVLIGDFPQLPGVKSPIVANSS